MLRVQKFLSMTGIESRRKCEQSIISGEVKINGIVAKLGDKVKFNDVVTIGRKKIQFTESLLNFDRKILIYHKKIGQIVSTRTKKVKDTVFDRLPKINEKWINIGRLDVMTSGLILFTNDGNLAHRLTHPSSNIKRTYLAKISNEISKHAKNLSISGVDIGRGQIGRFSEFTEYKKEDRVYEVSLYTGKNREVRRIFSALQYEVQSLKRISFGNIDLGRLKYGDYRLLNRKEVSLLLD